MTSMHCRRPISHTCSRVVDMTPIDSGLSAIYMCAAGSDRGILEGNH